MKLDALQAQAPQWKVWWQEEGKDTLKFLAAAASVLGTLVMTWWKGSFWVLLYSVAMFFLLAGLLELGGRYHALWFWLCHGKPRPDTFYPSRSLIQISGLDCLYHPETIAKELAQSLQELPPWMMEEFLGPTLPRDRWKRRFWKHYRELALVRTLSGSF